MRPRQSCLPPVATLIWISIDACGIPRNGVRRCEEIHGGACPTSVMEEVNDNELPLEPLHYRAVEIASAELPPMATASADGQMCAAEGGLGADGDAEPQASEQLIGQIDPKTPGCTHRFELELLLQEGCLALGDAAPLRKQYGGSLTTGRHSNHACTGYKLRYARGGL